MMFGCFPIETVPAYRKVKKSLKRFGISYAPDFVNLSEPIFTEVRSGETQ